MPRPAPNCEGAVSYTHLDVYKRQSHLSAQMRLLSPQSTLDRGYAVVAHPDGRVVRDRAEVGADDLLRVLVAHGDFGVRVIGRA